MRLGYLGSPEISAALLGALCDSEEHEVALVVSNPDRPVGRSGQPRPTPVARLAAERGIPVERWPRLKPPEVEARLRAAACDLFVVFAYGRILPASIIDVPRLGTVNLHASLLPELRGASPIQSAILRGFEQTGWSLQQMVPELDAGDVLASVALEIRLGETAGELTERMLPSGIELTLQTLSRFEEARRERVPQDPQLATHCSKLSVEMSVIDWSAPVLRIHNLVRALNPWPVARAWFRGSLLKLLRTMPLAAAAENQLPALPPARLLAAKLDGNRGLFVGTGAGILQILELQPENRRAMSGPDFINGLRLADGESLSDRPNQGPNT